jgi:predicted nucleotidyltransferase
MSPIDELPEDVRSGLAAFAAAARAVFGDDLVSLVLFGSAAEGRLRATSDVNLVVVLARSDPAKLEAIGEAYRFAHATIRLSAMFLLESEIAVASEAFAVKFGDIASRHHVLEGRDPFAALAIPREASIRRLRQVLLNLTLRLRERQAMASVYPEQLAWLAADAVGPLRASAAAVLALESGETVIPRDALRRVADADGQAPAVATIEEARERGGAPAAGGSAAVDAAITLATCLAARAARLA